MKADEIRLPAHTHGIRIWCAATGEVVLQARNTEWHHFLDFCLSDFSGGIVTTLWSVMSPS